MLTAEETKTIAMLLSELLCPKTRSRGETTKIILAFCDGLKQTIGVNTGHVVPPAGEKPVTVLPRPEAQLPNPEEDKPLTEDMPF